MEKIKAKLVLEEDAIEPTKAHSTDAGFDLYTREDIEILPKQSYATDTGVHILIPEGYVGMIKSKSGLNVKDSIQTEGVVDAGYTGSIVVKIYNNGNKPKIFKVGNKITQLVVLPIPEVELELTDFFNEETDRGDNGFGSSGV